MINSKPQNPDVKIPKFKQEVTDAMEEAKQISRDPNTKRYRSFAEALEDIDRCE